MFYRALDPLVSRRLATLYAEHGAPRILNMSVRVCGGLLFVKVGRLGFSLYLSNTYRPIKGA